MAWYYSTPRNTLLRAPPQVNRQDKGGKLLAALPYHMCTQALQIQEILQKFASVASQPGGLSQLEPGRKPGVIPVPLVERVHYGVQLSTAQRFSVRQLCAVALLGVSSCATQSGTGDASVANHNTEGRHTRKQVHPKHSVRDPSLYTSPRRPQVFGCGSTSCRGCRKPNGPVPSCTKPEPTPGSRVQASKPEQCRRRS